MSLKTLQRAILASAQTLLANPKLRMADISEWSTSEKAVRDGTRGLGEIVIYVPDPGVWIAVDAKHDKRPGDSPSPVPQHNHLKDLDLS